MKDANDFYADFDNLEISAKNFQRFTFDQAWIQAHRYTERMAVIDTHEMLDLRSRPKDEAWGEHLAEESRKAN